MFGEGAQRQTRDDRVRFARVVNIYFYAILYLPILGRSRFQPCPASSNFAPVPRSPGPKLGTSSLLPPMNLISTADFIEFNDTDDIVFLKGEWIGKNKEFPPRANIPQFIFTAYTEAFAVPPNLQNHFPHNDLTVLAFMKFKLPSQTATPSFIKPDAWFCQDDPTSNLTALLTRTIPHGYLLAELERLSRQAWFDAHQSIMDRRYNTGTAEYFPLSVLTLWRKLEAAIIAQQRWTQSTDWLAAQLLTTEPMSQAHLIFQRSKDLLLCLPYHGDLETKGVKCTTLEFTRLFGQQGEAAWLSGDLLDLAVENLNQRLAVVADTHAFVGNLLLMQEIRRSVKGKGMSKRVYQIGMRASSGDIMSIYLITLINKHWVTIHADVSTGTITYGQF